MAINCSREGEQSRETFIERANCKLVRERESKREREGDEWNTHKWEWNALTAVVVLLIVVVCC